MSLPALSAPETLAPDTSAPEASAAAPLDRPAPLKRRPVRIGLGLAGALTLAAVGTVGWNWWTAGRFIQATNDAYLQADQVTVAPKVSGYVDEVLVGDNQQVQAGQPLVRIDARDPQAQFDQAQGQIAEGLASIREAEAQIQGQQAQIAQAQAQTDAARATADFARREVERYGPLAASGAETKEHLDQLRQSRDQSAAQLQASSAQVLSAQRQIATLRAQIGVAQARVEQAQARARQAKTDLDSIVVRASISGRIGDRSVRPGQYVQPGTKLMSVVPVQAIYLTANFKETQIGRMRPGQPVSVKVDALGDRRLKGVVDSFSPGTGAQFALIPPANATGNFTKIVQRVPVRILVQAPADARPVLLPGLSVEAAVDTRPQPAGPKGRAG